ncbi:hypothetical protein JNO63_00990 [Anaerococcus sp. mt242]|nr:hypothetical protein [Anaerococcus sp. mt242]MBM0045659.1 hypothetical protein [Anaerococcus sp. mt242]
MMRIVIIVIGSVESNIVSILAEEGHDVLIIEKDPDVLEYVLADTY